MSIFVNGDFGFVWDMDLNALLKDSRIVGHSLGRGGQLPIRLLPEQVKLAVELRLAQTVQSVYSEATEANVSDFNRKRLDELDIYGQQKLDYHETMKGLHLTGRRSEARTILRPVAPMSVELNSERLGWHKVHPIEFAWPNTKGELARFRIFKYLYEKSFYITTGSKFGGDYLLYEDKVENCHAKYIVLVRETISPLDLISHARVGTQTKKIFVMASYDHEKDKVQCTTFEWTGWV